MIRTATLVVVAAALVGCKSGGDGPQKAEGEVSASVDRMIAGAESLDASKIAVKVKIENPKNEAVQVTGVSWSVDTGDLAGVLKGTSATSAKLEAGQTAEIEFKQEIPLPTDKEAYLAAIEKDVILLNVTGAVTLSNGDSVPFDRKGSVTTPMLPKFIVFDAQAARYGKDGLDVTFFLRVMNQNQFPVTIGSVEYAIVINGQELKREQGGIGTRLIAGSVQEFEVSIRFEQKSFKDTKAILASQKLVYSVVGQIDMDRLQIPFDVPGEINLAAASENEE